MVRKIILGIFVSFLAIFAMSHNANAINLNFENYSIRDSFSTSSLSCNVNLSVDISGSAFCRFPAQTQQMLLKSIQLTNTYRLYKGEIVEFYYVIYNNANFSTDGIVFLNDVQNISSDIITLNYELVDDFNSLDFSVATNNLPGENVGFVSDFWAKNRIAKVYKITQYVKADGLYYLGFGTTSSSVNRFVTQWYQLENSTLTFSLRNFTVYSPEESKENKEVEEKTQESVDQSTSDGNSSQSTVEGSTQSLMSAGGSIISALVNASATDCNINVQTTGSSRLFTTAIGQVNLCSDVPQGVLNMVQGIVALVFTPIVLYFTYNVLTTLYNQFKEYNS